MDDFLLLLHTGQLGSSLLIWAAVNCDVPKCGSCEYSKVEGTQQQLQPNLRFHQSNLP